MFSSREEAAGFGDETVCSPKPALFYGDRFRDRPLFPRCLGNPANGDLVRIKWPSGNVQELHNVAAQQFLTVTEPGGEPRLAARRENGQVQLTLTGKQGSRYALETSTALPNWTSADLTVTVTNPSGTVTFPAPGATNDAHRFYRAVWR